MKNFFVLITISLFYSATYAADGIVNVKSNFSVSHTADRFVGIAKKKGMSVMAHIKHSEGAKKVGVDIKPTELVIFGNPKIGAPLIACQRSIGIDLPQKMLVWEDDSGQVWLTYNDPVYIADRHQIKEECRGGLKKVAGALDKLSHKAGTSN